MFLSYKFQKFRILENFNFYLSYIVGLESKPHNSDFYQNDFLSKREYKKHTAHFVKFLYLQ